MVYTHSVCIMYPVFFFFFFKQKTAYEMRISDWSSDVCSSDLHEQGRSLDFGALAFDRERNTQAGFAAWTGRFGSHAFEAALRYDDNSQFGHESTANAAWAWQFSPRWRSEEHTSELQSLMRISYAVFCLKKKTTDKTKTQP